MKHYLQVTEDHLARAAGLGEAVQNPVQYRAASSRTELQAEMVENGKSLKNSSLHNNAAPYKDGAVGLMGDTGLEPVTSCMSSKRSSQLS